MASRRAFEFLLEPGALERVLDVHVLNTHGAAVAVTQNAEHVAELSLGPATKATGFEGSIEIPK
jgi:hypothetical protein